MAEVTSKKQFLGLIGSCALLLVLTPLFAIGSALENYALLYAALISFLSIAMAMVKNYLRIFIFFILFYLSIGLLNISSWRGYTTLDTLTLYAWAICALVLPILVFARRRIDVPFQLAHQQKLLKTVVIGHQAIVLLSVLFVYSTIGNVLVQQELRFQIPTGLGYAIKSALPIAALLPFLRLKWPLMWLFVLLLPPIMIGSRGTAVISIVAYVIVVLHRNGGRLDLRTLLLRNWKYLLYALMALTIISLLFHLRRGNDSGLASVDVIMSHYFDYDNAFVRAIMPLYLGFKETIGLSTNIITEQVKNTINPYPLLFADLFTILPGENLAAGQSLSRMFGSTQDGGLTPGLLGGIYIDYGQSSIMAFGVMGIMLCTIQRSFACSPYFIIIYAQIIIQAIHLFHRGFIKPEYVTSILIAGFYYMLCHRVRLR